MEELSNEQIVLFLKNKFSNLYFESLFYRFKNLIQKYQSHYQIEFFDGDDYLQEARIIMYQSILSYDTSRAPYFASFYQRNLKYHFINIWRYNLAKKRGDGKYTIYLHDQYGRDDSRESMMDLLSDPYHIAHDDIIIIKEQSVKYFSKLSSFEKDIFKLHLEGLDHYEIAEKCNLSVASVRNAIDRCRYKLKDHFNIL